MADEKIDVKAVGDKVMKAVTPIIASAAASALVGDVLSVVLKVTATNRHHSDMTGDHDIHPTKQETTGQRNDTSASGTDESLAHDDVSAQKGEVDAAETEGKAATGEATATESGASAVRTKAGASDIETKALKMM